MPPSYEHGNYHKCHDGGCKPAENLESARDDKWTHDVRSHRHKHHHYHDGHSNDAVDDSTLEQGLTGIYGGEIKRDSEDGRNDDDRVEPSSLQELEAEP